MFLLRGGQKRKQTHAERSSCRTGSRAADLVDQVQWTVLLQQGRLGVLILKLTRGIAPARTEVDEAAIAARRSGSSTSTRKAAPRSSTTLEAEHAGPCEVEIAITKTSDCSEGVEDEDPAGACDCVRVSISRLSSSGKAAARALLFFVDAESMNLRVDDADSGRSCAQRALRFPPLNGCGPPQLRELERNTRTVRAARSLFPPTPASPRKSSAFSLRDIPKLLRTKMLRAFNGGSENTSRNVLREDADEKQTIVLRQTQVVCDLVLFRENDEDERWSLAGETTLAPIQFAKARPEKNEKASILSQLDEQISNATKLIDELDDCIDRSLPLGASTTCNSSVGDWTGLGEVSTRFNIPSFPPAPARRSEARTSTTVECLQLSPIGTARSEKTESVSRQSTATPPSISEIPLSARSLATTLDCFCADNADVDRRCGSHVPQNLATDDFD